MCVCDTTKPATLADIFLHTPLKKGKKGKKKKYLTKGVFLLEFRILVSKIIKIQGEIYYHIFPNIKMLERIFYIQQNRIFKKLFSETKKNFFCPHNIFLKISVKASSTIFFDQFSCTDPYLSLWTACMMIYHLFSKASIGSMSGSPVLRHYHLT